jgi:hypothetical protein
MEKNGSSLHLPGKDMAQVLLSLSSLFHFEHPLSLFVFELCFGD